jgi:hypothetical protein
MKKNITREEQLLRELSEQLSKISTAQKKKRISAFLQMTPEIQDKRDEHGAGSITEPNFSKSFYAKVKKDVMRNHGLDKVPDTVIFRISDFVSSCVLKNIQSPAKTGIRGAAKTAPKNAIKQKGEKTGAYHIKHKLSKELNADIICDGRLTYFIFHSKKASFKDRKAVIEIMLDKKKKLVFKTTFSKTNLNYSAKEISVKKADIRGAEITITLK